MTKSLFLFATTALSLAACGSAQDPQCPQGQFYDGQQCVTAQGPQCPPNQVFNGASCVSAQAPQCPPGQTWNGTACTAANTPPQCPPGQTWNGSACAAATTPPQCPPGQTWNGTACAGSTPPPATGCAPAQSVDPTVAAGATQLLATLGLQHAPAGARPVGSVMAGQFQAGQCLTQRVQLQPGKCYTVVGNSLPGIADLDVTFVPVSPVPGVKLPPIAQDQTDGPQAILGGKPNCYKWLPPFAGGVDVIVTVASGQGIAAAQIYEK